MHWNAGSTVSFDRLVVTRLSDAQAYAHTRHGTIPLPGFFQDTNRLVGSNKVRFIPPDRQSPQSILAQALTQVFQALRRVGAVGGGCFAFTRTMIAPALRHTFGAVRQNKGH